MSTKVWTPQIENADGSKVDLVLNESSIVSTDGTTLDQKMAALDSGTLTVGQADSATTLNGLTATVAELNYVDGVTSNIQTQLNGKAASSHGTHVSYGTSAEALGTSSAGSATTVSRSDHVHALPDLTSCTGTLTVAKGGTGATTFTSGAALIGAGTGSVTTRAITNLTAKGAVTGSTNLATANTVLYHAQNRLNRTTAVNAADTAYTTYMARAIAAGTTDMTAGTSTLTSGSIYVVYE